MGVNWRSPVARRMGPSFIRVPPKKVVVVLAEPKDYAILLVHWDPQSNGSYPCLAPDHCRLCPDRSWLTTYAPALVWASSAQRWVQGILPLGDAGGGLATQDLYGFAAIVGKEGSESKRGRSIYYGRNTDERIPPHPPTKSFDVRPFLLRRWGLFKEADLLECEFHPGDATLAFPEERTA